MNKMRHPQANWFCEPFSVRTKLMAEHATSGIKFAGKVSQLITASTGFDNWEWGVTLWGRAPEYIKDIVYTMRFDEASARYAEFGPFYIGYILAGSRGARPPADLTADDVGSPSFPSSGLGTPAPEAPLRANRENVLNPIRPIRRGGLKREQYSL